jgi:hypothetical protein
MAVSQSQIVDLLYKQAFGVTKTDTATNKSPSNENIPSPLLIRGDTIWTQADQIPPTATATAGIVQAYTGVNAIECIADNTTVPIGGIYPTWLTELTYWIPSEFGSTYTAQVWVDNPGVANPTLTGTQIFAAGSGGTGQYYYNYQSGVLNFIGETIPASLTSGKVLYIVGYRYIGEVGVTNLPNNTTIGNLNFTGTTISSTTTNGNIIITPNGNGIVQVSSALTSNANITANFFIGNGSQLTGVAASNAVSSGTVTDNAQPNITSVGTLISLNVSGNITAGNIIGTLANGNSNINIPNANGNINLTAVGNTTMVVTGTGVNVEGNLTATGSLTLTSGNISNANVVSANTVSANLLATTSNVTSNSITNNLTVNLAISGNTANFTGNIITLNANLGNAASANYFIGNGSLLTGVAASNAVSSGTVTDNAQPNITSVGTLISLDISGNLSAGNANLGNLVVANFFSGSGNLLSNIQGSNITGNVTSAITANFANYAGNVTVSTQPNITSVGTLVSLDVAGNISSGNIIAGVGSGGSITGANLVSANYFVGNFYGTANSATTAGTVTTNAQPNITSVGTLVSLNISGNLTAENANLGNLATANFFSGSGANLTNIPAGNISGQVANATVAGTVYTNAQPNITSVGTLTSLSVTGNISSENANLGNLATANFFSGSGNLLSNIQGSNITGNVTSAITANFANYAGTVITNAQPNITSTGTLTDLTVSGHLTANTFQMGYGIYAFYSTSVFFATTASTSANQLLWGYPAADLSAIDFTIIATDSVGATRQSCKISAAILGTTVAYNEYGGLFINGGVGSFSVIYNGSGPTPTLELVVTPDSSNLTEYNMLISKYLV